MPDATTDLAGKIKQGVSDVADSAPVVAIGKGIAAVGDVAQGVFDKASEMVRPYMPKKKKKDDEPPPPVTKRAVTKQPTKKMSGKR